MAVKKMPINLFVKEIGEAYNRKDGYIMGATGQDPKKWSVNSWWFTQYNGNAKQKAKALYWREHAKRVWDCQGLAEGIYSDFSGTKVNVKARNNYAEWCDPKGKGMIPADKRVPGAAVFWGDSASSIHHVGYLYKPVDSKNPKGDWYIIEARGVLYGVVMTKLLSRKPNYWGYMTKYFDYSQTITIEVPKPEPKPEPILVDPKNAYVNVRHGNYYVRTDASKDAKSIGVVKTGEKYDYLGETKDGWFKILFKNQIGWVSIKCGDLVAKEAIDFVKIKGGSWNVRIEPNSKSKSIGIVRTGDLIEYRHEIANGWYAIRYKDQDAWVSEKGVEK